jgi:adenylate kinase
MHLVIYGPEGSGKGTQAKTLGDRMKLPVITSGDLVREAAVGRADGIGLTCRQVLTEGKYVSDEVMFELWRDKLWEKNAKDGFILDGFPRNINQANFLLKQVSSAGYKIDRFIYLKLDDKDAIERLSKRNRKLFSGSTINHDEPERVKQRLVSYRSAEKPILELFRKYGLLLEIDAGRSVSEVSQDIERKLSET